MADSRPERVMRPTVDELISIRDSDALRDTLGRWFKAYAEHKGTEAADWLGEELRQALPEVDGQKLDAVVGDIIANTQAIASAHESLQRARERGMSRGEWFYRQLEKTTKDMDRNTLGDMVGQWTSSLAGQFEQRVRDTVSGETGPLVSTTVPLPVPPNGWNDVAIRQTVLDGQKLFSALNVLELGKLADADTVMDAVRDFPFADTIAEAVANGDANFGATLACALKEASDKDIIDVGGMLNIPLDNPLLMDGKDGLPNMDSPVLMDGPGGWSGQGGPIVLQGPVFASLSSTVSGSLRIAKEVAEGKMDADMAVDAMVDGAVATASGVVRQAFRAGGARLGAVVGTYVSTVLPFIPMPVAQKVGSAVGGFLGEHVAEPVCRAVRKVGEVAKSIGHKIVEGAKSVVRSVGNAVSSCVSSVCSFIGSIF